jgi:hypothetical protein
MSTATPHPSALAALFLDLGAVRRLVRDALGCQCAEEVFREIVVGSPTVFGDARASSDLEILVGRRLLVEVVRVEALPTDPPELRRAVRALLERGRATRDEHRLNRYRLVLVGDLAEEIANALRSEAAALDERLHVHSLALEDLQGLLRAPS